MDAREAKAAQSIEDDDKEELELIANLREECFVRLMRV